MNLYNQVALQRFQRMWREQLPVGSTFFLSLPLPALGIGEKLGRLEEDIDRTRPNLNLTRTTFVHTTVLSPRPALQSFPCEALALLASNTRSWETTLIDATYFQDSELIVGTYSDPEPFKLLHTHVLSLSGLPQGDPTYEGDNYNPHVTLGQTVSPGQDIPFLVNELELPCSWEVCRLDVFVKLPGWRLYQEAGFFVFE